uniref:Aldehyde oxidase/xanthine dehydrogenase a/b hammerhead domain-containing protein n=1 Tax=Oryza brachyantha TaxID=4533 RepID=J3N0T9_ORYBR
MARRLSFPSDIATVLLAAGSTVTIQQVASKSVCLTLEEFLKQPPCDSRTLVISISIPWGSDDGIAFETFRAASRPFGNAVSYVNSAFLARSSVDAVSGNRLVEDVFLAFGAFGSKHAIRARKVEEYLKGKLVSAPVILEAVHLLRGVVSLADGTTHPKYRVSLAISFLFRFLSSLANGLDEPENADSVPNNSCTTNGATSGKTESKVDSSDLPIKSREEMVFSDEYKPVGKPIEKAGPLLQASGEAVYVDDIPAPKDCLYGAFIYSTHPRAHIKGVNFRSSLASQKVITVITAKDIPTGGENVGSCFLPMLGDEALFADPVSEFAGQNFGVVIAETQKYAYMAAKQAVIEYSTENLQPPILTVEDAVQNNSYFEVPSFLTPMPIGGFNQAMSEADHKIIGGEVKLVSQYYFYIETQAALAIPDEDNCITIYCSTQMPELTQHIVASCLGIAYHNVRIITRRVGGFGGKAMKAIHVATACAVAVFKLRRPVRMYLDRKTDMIMTGGQHPMKVKYSVGFKSDGRITALHLDLKINAGISMDFSPVMPSAIVGALKKYNWGALVFDIKVCKTNVSSRSAMRAPGDAQGSFIAEAIVEHVASALSLDTNDIRRKNLHDFESLKLFFGDSTGEASTYSLVTIFDKLASSPEYQRRVAMVEQFNGSNRWKKRGISCVPITYQVSLRPTPGKVSILNDGSIAVEVGGVEIGQDLWTKVRQMTAFALGQLCQDDGGGEGLLDKVRVIQADTLSMIQGGWTAGSTTSEASCEAVRKSCAALVERLVPIKERAGNVPWKSLIAQASMASVKLTEHAYWTPDPTSTSYLNYGAAISEVEVDV